MTIAQQDNVGNIYIDSQGRDPELPPIGLCFPLDSSLSPEAFEGALRVFLVLQSRNLICGISLIGWSSPNGKLLGREVWEGRLSAEALYSTCPDIRQFTTMTNVDQFSLSALFEIVKSQRDAIAIQGSPVLVQKATEVANEAAISKTTVLSPSRAPDVRIDGNLAVPLAISTVELYSKYVQALFDNFD